MSEWWFLGILLMSLTLGIIALTIYPTNTPVWSLFAVMIISTLFLIPGTLLLASANVGMGFGLLFNVLSGLWFSGNPEALIIVGAFGGHFNGAAESYIADQKMGHYAKLPPRAMFRGQMLSVFCNCFIFIGMLNWMVYNFNDGTLCQWDNKQHFVCTDAVLVFASAIEYGAFGVRNFFTLYPFLPWCFLVGSFVGIAWGLAHRYGRRIQEAAARRFSEARFAVWECCFFGPLRLLAWFDPAVFWAGALNWTGGNNLSYATNAIYISFIFMHVVKRRYPGWWEKYNYLLEAGFDVGVALSGSKWISVFECGCTSNTGSRGLLIEDVPAESRSFQSSKHWRWTLGLMLSWIGGATPLARLEWTI